MLEWERRVYGMISYPLENILESKKLMLGLILASGKPIVDWGMYFLLL